VSLTSYAADITIKTAGQGSSGMSRLARKIARAVLTGALPIRSRLHLAPHSIVLLLAAYAFLHAGFLDDSRTSKVQLSSAQRGTSVSEATAECLVLQDYFANPGLLKQSGRTPDELHRWFQAYDDHCR
jgi:hypothetical protein